MKDIYQTHTHTFRLHSNLVDGAKIVAIDKETQEMFESELNNLEKITVKTIEEALRGQSSNFKINMKRTQRALDLQISVSMEFLPKITQNIKLIKIKQSQAQKRALLLQIREDLELIQTNCSNIGKGNYLIFEKNSIHQNQQQFYSLEKGRYLIQISGFVILESDYNMEDDYNFNGNINRKQFQIVVQFYNEKQIKMKEDKVFTFTYEYNDGYENIFNSSLVVDGEVNQRMKVCSKFVNNNNNNFTISNYILTIAALY